MDLVALLAASDDGIGADHAWLVRNALSYLELSDAMRLIVAVLESGGRFGVRRRVHWLRYGDAPIPPIDETALLDQAAMHSCWRALIILLEDLKERSPSWVTQYDDHIQEVSHVTRSTLSQRATMAHRGTHYRFGIHVVNNAASRGHLSAVQWLLPRSARESGQVEPTQSAADVDRRFFLKEALRSAANARKLHVVDWIVQASPHLHCVLPYDAELEAVAWIVRNDKNPNWSEYACATAAHGFSATSGYSQSPDEPFEICMTKLPLADGFARGGDIATLEKVYARANHRQLIGGQAITEAAEHGHLDIVQWIHCRFPNAPTVACISAASSHGNIAMLEWLQQQQYLLRMFSSTIVPAAVRYGHAHVLRWFASIDPIATGTALPLEVAVQHGHVAVVRYLHEDCELVLERDTALDALVVCGENASVELYEYVLDRVGPLRDEQEFLQRVLAHAACPPLDAVQHLVLTRGFWSREAFAVSTGHSDLALTQFLYTHAQTRARDLHTTLGEQVNFTGIEIGNHYDAALAEWLLSLPEGLPVWTPSSTPSIDHGFLTSPARQRVLLACIRHRPDECRAVAWLPVWAVRAHSLDTLELLCQGGHPHARDVATFRAIVEHTRDARFLLKLLPLPAQKEPEARRSLTNEVVDWAARFGMVSVLERVLKNRDAPSQKQLLRHVMQQKGFSSHAQVVDWLLKRCEQLGVASTTTIAQAITMDAACHGHLSSLANPELLGDMVDSMITEAAKRRQVRSLEWLLGMCTVSTELLARTLVEAVQLKHIEIVELLTRRYEPRKLPLGSDDRVRIRAFLESQASGSTEHAPQKSSEQVLNEKTDSSPRKKRKY